MSTMEELILVRNCKW